MTLAVIGGIALFLIFVTWVLINVVPEVRERLRAHREWIEEHNIDT